MFDANAVVAYADVDRLTACFQIAGRNTALIVELAIAADTILFDKAGCALKNASWIALKRATCVVAFTGNNARIGPLAPPPTAREGFPIDVADLRTLGCDGADQLTITAPFVFRALVDDAFLCRPKLGVGENGGRHVRIFIQAAEAFAPLAAGAVLIVDTFPAGALTFGAGSERGTLVDGIGIDALLRSGIARAVATDVDTAHQLAIRPFDAFIAWV